MQRTNEILWTNVVHGVKMSNKGGNHGQWSARKAQLAVKLYKKRGGRYINRKSNKNSLVKWTRQKWRTMSGKPSIMGPTATGERYLPEKIIKSLKKSKRSKKLYNDSTFLKRRALKRNKQYSRQPVKLRKILGHFLRK